MNIEERAVLIRISQTWRPRMQESELYEKTRKWWRLNPRRDPDYAVAVRAGTVLGVYAIDGWVQSPDGRRWAFEGRRDDALSERYTGSDVSHYFRRGAANPITYVNC